MFQNPSSIFADVCWWADFKWQATSTRDAFIKMLYSKLFEYIVEMVNKALNVTASGGDSPLNVSVLDIFGFEIFPQNYFEQFCINHANEKLQLHFNQFNFMQVMSVSTDSCAMRAKSRETCREIVLCVRASLLPDRSKMQQLHRQGRSKRHRNVVLIQNLICD